MRRWLRAAVLSALVWPCVAVAGGGPWVLGRGDQSLYVGLDSQRISKLTVTGDSGVSVVDVDARITTFSAKAALAYGIGTRVEVEGWLPWSRSWVARDDLFPCGGLGLGECRTTEGVGVIEARVKALLVDELVGAPLSVSGGLHARFGGLTHATRARLTNLGEGTTDLGGFVSVGRIGGLGRGYWSGHADASGFYRIPNTRTYPQADGSRAAPGGDFLFNSDLLLTPTAGYEVSFGPTVSVFWRPFGVNWDEVDFSDPDRFAALRVLSPRVGGKLIVRDGAKVAFSLSALQTVAPVNNPSPFTVSVGVSINSLFSREDR